MPSDEHADDVDRSGVPHVESVDALVWEDEEGVVWKRVWEDGEGPRDVRVRGNTL